MALGTLKSNYELLFSPTDSAKSSQTARINALARMTDEHCAAAAHYFTRVSGVVYFVKGPPSSADAAFLIGCDREFMAAIPPGAQFRAFKPYKNESVGFVGDKAGVLNWVSGDDKDDGNTVERSGLKYQLIGAQANKKVFARLDRAAIQATQAGKSITEPQFAVYQTAMEKGVIPSSSTGSDGVKNEGTSTWVIKLTISTAKVNLLDNTVSPLDDAPQQDDKGIYLNFNKLTKRH